MNWPKRLCRIQHFIYLNFQNRNGSDAKVFKLKRMFKLNNNEENTQGTPQKDPIKQKLRQ